VRSRISWGAIIAGAVVSIAVYFVLTLFAAAIGLSVRHNVTAETMGTGAAIAAVVTALVSLFLGGWVSSQLAVGENKSEAIIYGVVLWGVVFAMLLWLMASGVQAGFNAMLGATTAVRPGANVTWEEAARQAGVPQDRINDWKNQAAEARRAIEDPAARQQAGETATAATWWSLAGTVLSMLAAVGGAYLGAGPDFRLIPVAGYRSEATRVVVQP
jgi:hypothetical protein